MKLIDKMVEYFTRLNKRMKRWQRVVSVLSAIVVFVTTYALILPAITLDVDTASTQAGIEVASENEPDAAGTVYESAEEEANDGSSEEEEITESSDNGSAVTESSTQEDAEEADAADTSAAEASAAAATTSKAADTAASTAASTVESVIADTAAAASTEEAPALITEATQLTYQGKDYIVYADFDGSAQLPVGVELKVKEITKESDPEAYEVYYKKALEELKDKYDENTGLSFAKFYDISFVFKGQEVEPKGNVNIKIEYKEAVEIEEQTKVDTIHFNKEEEEKAEIIDSEKEVKDDTKVESVEFESDKFSVYGVIGTETFTEKFLTEDGETYNISVTAGAEAHIPADAHLEISEVKEGSDKYDELFAKAQAAVTDGKDASVPFARFFDISIVKDGEKIQPDAPVEVKITFDETVEADKNAKFNAVHITDNGADVIDVETEGEESEKAVTVDAVQFSAEGFSIYCVTYTVDFEYTDPGTGKTYYYSMDGEGSINLSDLLVVLGIKSEDEAAKFVAEEVTNVEFSDPELVKVTHKGKALGLFGKADWMLESLKPFDTEETLTISLKDGGEIVVKVTDDQTTGVWDLADTSNTKSLHVSTDSSVTTTEQERDASFKLTFTYSLKEDVVHAIDAYDKPFSLEYDLSSVIATSPLEIRNHSNGVISIGSRRLGTYKVVDGKVTLNFTDVSYFDGRSQFTGYFNLTAQTNESDLGDEDEYTYTFPGTGDTVPIKYKQKVESGGKQLQFEADADGNYTLHYTAKIDVTSDLDSLTFNDTIGGLQTLDPSSVKIAGKSVSVTQTGNGFTFNVASALGTTGVAKGSYQVTYDTKLTAEQLKNMTADKTTETNAVSWKVNGSKDVDGGKTTQDFEKPKEPIPVVKRISATASQPGDYVDYTITFGKDTTVLSGFHISDVMTDVVIPQGNVTLTYNGQTTQVNFGAQAADTSYSKNNVTLFDYIFPEGTPGNGPVTATYRVKLIDADTAKANGVYDTTEVNNIATEHRQNTNDTKKTTVTYEKEPVYEVTKTEKSNKTDDGKWAPGTEIHYTLTIGDANTNMAGVNIKDVMTDLQTLQGDVMIKVGNGSSSMRLTDYVADAMKWVDDGNYSTNDVDLFNFNMPSGAGYGPVVITYTTKVITQDQATAASIFGDKTIKNTGTGGKQSDGTEGIGEFKEFPVTKDVTQNGASVNGQTVEMESTVHYVLTYGEEGMNLANAVIEDSMTDLQKLVGDITVKKSDGTTFTMPDASQEWGEDGSRWTYLDDGKYSTGSITLFKYKLPADIGEGPITIEYDAQIITEDEAKEFGINGTQSAFNKFIEAQTEVKIDFPKEVTHNPQVRKKFDHWDVENSKVYWNIIVEKDADSAYPLENVTVREAWNLNHVSITEPNQGYNTYNTFDASYFDVIHAVVTTDDGTVLSPGIDYTIDEANSKFIFPVLNERVHINLAFLSPAKIIDGYYMKNEVLLNDSTPAEADQTYHNPEIEAMKNGTYDENSRILTWEVQINPSAKPFTDSNPPVVIFKDTIPEGLELVNYDDPSNADDPTIKVVYGNSTYYVGNTIYDVPTYTDFANDTLSIQEQEGGTVISADIAPSQKDWKGDVSKSQSGGLSGKKVVVTYKTRLSEEEWNAITSSASGSELFQNHVDVTAGDDQHFEATDTVPVTSEGYLNKTDTTQEPGGIVIDPETGENSKNITYRVEINPNGYLLNNGKVLSLTDYIDTNMDLNPETVKLMYAHKEGEDLVPDGDAEGITVSYNDDTRLLHIQDIPDRTPLLLTYTCIARAQGTDTFTNTATLIGGGSHSDTDSKEHKIQVDEAGVAVDGISAYLLKIDENNVTKTLAGAQFQLYECPLAIGDLTEKPQEYWDNLLAQMDRITAGGGTDAEIAAIKEQFAITDWVPVGDPQTSREGGRIPGWEGLSEHKLYAWKEVTTPENYTGSSEYHYFVGYQFMDVNTEEPSQSKRLPEAEQTNRKHAAWALDDAAQLANDIRVASMASYTTWTATNVEDIYTSISATKEWEGDDDNKFETRPTGGIKLQLVRINADGSKDNVGDPVAINADKDGNWPTYIWNKLPSKDAGDNELKYTVVEERVDDYTTEYSDNGEGIAMGEITVTNKLIPKNTNIYVEKAFDQEGDEKPSEIHITLMIIKTDKEGNAGEPEEYMEYVLNEENHWKHVFEKLPTKEIGEDGNAYYLTYTVVEDLAAIEQQGFKYTVTYSDNGEGVLETTEEEPLLITNRAPRNGSLKINKKVTVNGEDPTTDTYPLVNGTYTFTIEKKDDTEFVPRTVDLLIDGNNIAQSEEITDLPAGTYVITETPVTGTELIEATIDDAATSYSNNSVEVEVVAGKVGDASPVVAFTNNATKIDFEKQWKNNNESTKWADDTAITVTVSGGALEYTYTITKADLTKGEIAGQPEGALPLIVKTVSEDDATKTYVYKFEVKGLPYNNGVAYRVTEEQVDKYKEPQYKTNGQDTPDGAMDGGAIINIAEESYELPESGGPGTKLFYGLGISFVGFAGLLLFIKRRELRDLSKRRW